MRRRLQQILFDCSVSLLILWSLLWIWSSFEGLMGIREKHVYSRNDRSAVAPDIERIESAGFTIANGRLGLMRRTQTYGDRLRTPRRAGEEVRWRWTIPSDTYWEGPAWWQRIGFVFNSQTRLLPPATSLTNPPDRSLSIAVPFWFLMILAALLAIPRLTRRVERDRRVAAGCCTRCGYDLRATPEKCPECGAIPSRAP